MREWGGIFETHREDNVKMKAETGVTYVQANEPPGFCAPADARGEALPDFSLRACRINQSCRYSDISLWPPDLGESQFLLL